MQEWVGWLCIITAVRKQQRRNILCPTQIYMGRVKRGLERGITQVKTMRFMGFAFLLLIVDHSTQLLFKCLKWGGESCLIRPYDYDFECDIKCFTG